MLPKIIKIDTSSTTNNINIKVSSIRTDSYEYYIKKSSESNFVKKYEGKHIEYRFEGLEQNVNYDIKVLVKNTNGEQEQIITRITNTMENLTQAEVEYTIEPNNWTNGNVTTKIKLNTNKDIEGLTLQYIKLVGEITSEDIQDANWKNYEDVGIISNTNETIYSRLYDGINSTSYTSRQITNIDKIAPNNFTISSSNVTTKSFVVSGTATDGTATSEYASSGIKNYTYYFKKSTDTSYTNAVQTVTSKTYSNLSAGTYNIYVVATDNASNTKQSNTINVTLGNVETITGATISPTGWTNENVTITLPKKSGYTTQYQINSITENWINYADSFVITTNSIIYYRYTDGVNVGNYATLNITNIDKIIPEKASIELSTQNITTASIVNAKITHIDANSGVNLAKSKWVYNSISTPIGTNESSYTGGTFSSNEQSISLSTSTIGTYYLHILTTDNAGNVQETISNAITVEIAKTYLYNYGDECTSITGGYSSGYSGITPSLQKMSNCLYIYADSNSETYGSNGYFTTNKYIDLTKYTKLNYLIDVQVNRNQYGADWEGRITGNSTIRTKISSTCTKKLVTMDISKVTGNYKITTNNVGGIFNSIVSRTYQIWLE